jgi:hypothetical protein
LVSKPLQEWINSLNPKKKMVENNKIKAVEEQCRKLDEKMQGIHQESWESMADQ